MTSDTTFRDIAGRLRSLRSMSPTTSGEVQQWTLRAGQIYDAIREAYPGVSLPIEVTHYLNDADIRFRDPAYRAEQERRMEEIIGSLEMGVLPGSHHVGVSLFPGVTLSLHRSCVPWLAAGVFACVGFFIWWFLR